MATSMYSWGSLQVGRRVRVPLASGPVVVGVVGVEGDALGGEVGLQVEQVVLEADPALGEANAVLLQQGPAIQLVRGEQAEDGVAAELRVGDGAAEHEPPDAAADTDLPGDDHVAAVALGEVADPLEPLLGEVVVVVDEGDELAPGEVEADVARGARPARVGDVPDHPVGVGRGEAVEQLPGAVSGAVVDEDDLEVPLRHRLGVEGADQVVDVLAGVVHGHDDADPARATPTCARPATPWAQFCAPSPRRDHGSPIRAGPGDLDPLADARTNGAVCRVVTTRHTAPLGSACRRARRASPR